MIAKDTPTYIDISRAKCEQRDRLIRDEWKLSKKLSLGHNVLEVPKTCGILTEREISITEDNDAVDIVEKIRQQEYTAEEVTVAFCKRAAIAQQLVSFYWPFSEIWRSLLPRRTA
jgi:amidase